MLFVDVSIQNKMAGWLNRTHPFSDTFWKGSREKKPFFFLLEWHTLLGCVQLYPNCPDIFPLTSLFFSTKILIKFAFPCFSQLKAWSEQTDTSSYSSFWRHLEKVPEGHQWELHLHNLSRVSVREVSGFELLASKVLPFLSIGLVSLKHDLGKQLWFFSSSCGKLMLSQ